MSDTVLGTIVVAVVTVGGSWLVARTSARSTQRSAEKAVAGQIESSRLQAEENAFNRAKGYYEGVIERQDSEIEELRADATNDRREIADQRTEVTRLHAELARCKNACRALARATNRPEPDLD